jgi:two-component system, sensor histidine kinase
MSGNHGPDAGATRPQGMVEPDKADAAPPEPPLILVVDDEDAGRFVKLQILMRAGFRVIDTATGQGALELARRQNPDLVLLDVNLPDISGFEIAARLKAEATPPAVQVIQVSHTAITTADRVRSLGAGADAYLVEPIDSDVLVATIRAHLRVRNVERELAAAAIREQAARKEAERANSLKDEFLAGLSHELRTPMNAILGWIWQLKHSTPSEAARERALASLERSAKLQNQLINDLLDVSRISKGKMHLELRVLDISQAIETAADTARHLADANGIELAVDAPSALVCGDSVRLQQVFTNLLTNAVQFTPAGGRVEIVGSAGPSSVTAAVRDNGAGIAASFLPHVFDKFRQAESGLSRQHGGLGVGLSITREVVALHDGEVEATSDGPGRGATFSVTLPLASTSVQRLQAVHPGEPILRGLRIAIVEEDALQRTLLSTTLEASGARVTALGDASELGDGCSCDLIVSRHSFGGSPAVRSLALDQISHQHSPRSSVVTIPPATLVAAIADALS